MWLMTSFGILMPSDRTRFTPEGDPRTLQVRCRRSRPLEILKALYLPDLGEIEHTPTFDYNYRAYCTPQQFADAASKIALDIDYEKFKPTTVRYDDSKLHEVYNAIWGVMTRLGKPWEALPDPIWEKHGPSSYVFDGDPSNDDSGWDDATVPLTRRERIAQRRRRKHASRV